VHLTYIHGNECPFPGTMGEGFNKIEPTETSRIYDNLEILEIFERRSSL
jgi:tagatose-1,6-bisphosphate aldolase non-catalytic subunit AgaZ/GatZ